MAADELDERPYVGRSYWQRLAHRPGDPVPHVHRCPGCYRAVRCDLDCTLEPDLEMPDGTPSGCFAPCADDPCHGLWFTNAATGYTMARRR